MPETRISTKEALAGCKQELLFDLEEFTGIKSRRVVSENEYGIDLTINASEKCFEISKHLPEDIEMILACSITRVNGPDHEFSCLPTTAAKVAAHFGLTDVIAFDVSNACAGMFSGIQIMDSYIKAGVIKKGLVVSGDYISHLLKNAQMEIGEGIDPQLASLTLGDSGAAVILEATEDQSLGFHDVDIFSIGKYGDLCVATISNKEHGGYVMHTDSLTLLDSVVRYTGEHVAHSLTANNNDKEFDHVIFHQVSNKFIHASAEQTNKFAGRDVCSPENVLYNVERRGNTSTTSHFIALWDNILNGKIKSDEELLFGIQASGITIGVSSYTLDDLPARVLQAEKSEKVKEELALN